MVVVSLFVNPTQFNESSDLEAYPRDEARDARLAEEHGVDLLFVPSVSEMYPRGILHHGERRRRDRARWRASTGAASTSTRLPPW